MGNLLVLAANTSGGDAFTALIFLALLGLAFYFVPWIVAASRQHNNQGPIAVVNIFLGWTLIGWVVALAMACTGNVKK
jgi:hypothetical protein